MEHYTEIKSTGFEWAKKVPNNWNTILFWQATTRIGTGLNPRNNFELSNSDDFYYVTIRNFKDGKIYLDDNCDKISHEAWEIIQQRSQLQKGDILFASISKDAQAYILIDEPENWNINESVFCIRVNKKYYINEFFYYNLIDEKYYEDLHLDATGATFQSIKQNKLKSSKLILPPIDTQKKIVKYLDYKIVKINTLISKLEYQAEMLEIYKRELIANAITKGLNNISSMKDSGVDWIGDVPEHWNVTKMKWMFEIVKRIYGAEDRDVLSITQRGIKIKDIKSNDGQLAESYANYQLVNVNDFAMNSMDLLTGWVDCSPYEGVTSPDYRVFRFLPDKQQCHSYYKYLFQMCYTNRIFYRLGQGVSNLGRWRLQADQFLNMRLPRPPVEEQKQIATYLDTKVGQIEELTSDIKVQIEKLKEYRKIVIHDAVTGKIKVTEDE